MQRTHDAVPDLGLPRVFAAEYAVRADHLAKRDGYVARSLRERYAVQRTTSAPYMSKRDAPHVIQQLSAAYRQGGCVLRVSLGKRIARELNRAHMFRDIGFARRRDAS